MQKTGFSGLFFIFILWIPIKNLASSEEIFHILSLKNSLKTNFRNLC